LFTSLDIVFLPWGKSPVVEGGRLPLPISQVSRSKNPLRGTGAVSSADERAPLYAVEGHWGGCAVETSLMMMVAALLYTLVCCVITYEKLSSDPTGQAVAAGLGGLGVVAAAIFKWIHARARRNSWRAEFYDEGIEFKDRAGKTPRVIAPWSDIAWFSDHDADCVQIRLKGFVSSLIDLQIPTRTEEERIHVLDLLVRFGVQRRDG